jgi:DNA primase
MAQAALSAAAELYTNRLLADAGALAYLAGRGIAYDTVERCRLGYASGDELTPYLAWRKVPLDAAYRCGLVDKGGSERLAGRIVFPEFRDGQAIWLIGRLLHDDELEPKYRGLYGGKPLLGWDAASKDLRCVCLVEGPIDMLALRQWDLPAIALCGTWISNAAMRDLNQWRRIYAILDADSAGMQGVDRLVEASGSRLVHVRLPASVKDPGELAVRTDGKALLQASIRAAITRHERECATRLVSDHRDLASKVTAN